MEQQRLKEMLDYNEESGLFVWRRRPRTCRVQVGDVAGYINSKGYVYIGLDGKGHLGQRLAWLYVHGVLPALEVDHINGIRSDNSLRNLRLTTHAENQQNRRVPSKSSKTGYLGVEFDMKKKSRPWIARIRVDGRSLRLGTFDSAEEASHAYIAAKQKLHSFSTLTT